MKSKFNKFLIVGLVACSTAFVADKFVNQPTTQEYANMLTSVVQQENLDVTPLISKDNHFESKATLSLSKESSRVVKLNLGSITTSILKMMAPISALKSSTRGVYDFIALHEYSHGQLNYMMQNEKKFFDISIGGFSEKDMTKIEVNFEKFFKAKPNTYLAANLHENFADAYASILMVRNLSDRYSDKEIKDIITYRYNQVKNQNEVIFGALGDLEHRTDLAIKKVLDTDFKDIRSMSSEDAQKFTMKIASTSTVEKFSGIYKTLITNNFELEKTSKEALVAFDIKDSSQAMLSMKKIRDSSLATKASSVKNSI